VGPLLFSMVNRGAIFFLDSNDAHRLVFVMEWWRLVIHISDPKDVGLTSILVTLRS
jgi:hypothetical protein